MRRRVRAAGRGEAPLTALARQLTRASLACFSAAALCGALACAASTPVAPGAPEAGRGRRAVGWVRTQRVDLLQLRVQLELAYGCRRSPQPREGSSVLRRAQVVGARCRTRPFDGRLPVYAVDEQGRRWGPLWEEEIEQGALTLDFAAVEAAVGVLGVPSASVETLELGDGAWAGAVSMSRLRAFVIRWHDHWVRRGRGSAVLWTAAHPEDPQLQAMRGLAIEARLARQERDYLRVAAGELSPRDFLERHLWSPYRSSVLRLERRR